jgi:hypothetical protein
MPLAMQHSERWELECLGAARLFTFLFFGERRRRRSDQRSGWCGESDEVVVIDTHPWFGQVCAKRELERHRVTKRRPHGGGVRVYES